MRSKWSCDVDHSPDRLRACVVSWPEKKPPPELAGAVCCVRCVCWGCSDDVDLACGDEVGALEATDVEQLLGVSGEVAAGGVEELAGI